MEILKPRARGVGRRTSLAFERIGDPGSGYGFDCDAAGVPTFANPSQRDNYNRVKDHPAYRCLGVRVEEWTYAIPAVGRCGCGCGRQVTLDGFTNACDCGRDYNMNGQLLAPRDQWGEETGEHPADIARLL
jgi:hypothetical protein